MFTQPTDIYTLHVDDLSLQLVPPIELPKLVHQLAATMEDGTVVQVPVQASTLDGHVALVRPSCARVVYVSHDQLVVQIQGGKGSPAV